jgi:DNA-binding HxlR family transcriptional regulator
MKQTISGCPIEDAMRLLSGRWRTLLIYYLVNGPKRFGELRRELGKISQRMLTHELRMLEDAGVIARTVHPGRVAHVEYELTEAGRKLLPLIDALGEWWEELERSRNASTTAQKTAS